MGPPPTQPRAASGNSPIGTVLSWLAIIGVVGFVAVRVWIGSHSSSAEEAGDDITLQMASRTAVGFHILFDAKAIAAASRAKMRDATAQIVEQAHTPRQRLCAVAVVGEMNGAPAALDELERCRGILGSATLKADAQSLHTIYTIGAPELSRNARARLAADLGWHGQLALSFQLPAGQDPRPRIISTSLRAVGAAYGLEGLIVIVLLAGTALLTIAVVRMIDGKVLLAYHPTPTPPGPFLEAFALYLIGYMGIGYLAHTLHIKPVWLVYAMELAWIAAACFWPLLRGVTLKQLRQGLGWHTGRGVFREALAGIGGYLAGMPFLTVAIYFTSLLSKLSGDKPIHPIVFAAGGGAGAIIGLFLLASVWAPIIEETMFRGALFNHLRATHRWIVSAVLSGIIFASLHPQGWTAIPVLAAIGIIFAAIREWRGTVLASGIAHALNNAVATTVMVLVLS